MGLMAATAALGIAMLQVIDGQLPSPFTLVLVFAAAALGVGKMGRFLRDWAPALMIMVGYGMAVKAAAAVQLPVHYHPQILLDREIGGGTVPTVWLQQHLWNGHVGPLELLSLFMYATHFFWPLAFAFYLWWWRRGEGFYDHIYGHIVVAVLAEITYVVAPSAPPWLAARHHLIAPVHDVLKTTLNHVGLTTLAAAKGNAAAYDIVAAFPSMHAAFPLIGLFVIFKYRLPLWLLVLQLGRTIGVWFSIVYTGEHFVTDILGSILYAAIAWWIVQRALTRRERRRARVIEIATKSADLRAAA